MICRVILEPFCFKFGAVDTQCLQPVHIKTYLYPLHVFFWKYVTLLKSHMVHGLRTIVDSNTVRHVVSSVPIGSFLEYLIFI